VRRGPYGLYVQQGEPQEKEKPKRTSLPRGVDGETITLEQALGLLSLPRLVGLHPESKAPIEAGIGRFGPYVKMGSIFASLDRDDDVLVLGLNRAVDLLAKKMASVRTIGLAPKDGVAVMVKKGRFGPYAQKGQTVANLPRDVMMDDITLDQALALLAEKGKTLKMKGGAKKAPTKKTPARKEAAAKTETPKKAAAVKKPVAKKATVKKSAVKKKAK
jgi:DNA topoisomerase-1